MKNKTLKLTTLIVAIGLIIFTTSAFNKQQTGGNKFLTMRAIENGPGGSDSRITIIYEDNKSEEIPLKTWRPSNWTGNLQKINETLNKLSAQGYQLIATSGTDALSTTYTFIKK